MRGGRVSGESRTWRWGGARRVVREAGGVGDESEFLPGQKPREVGWAILRKVRGGGRVCAGRARVDLDKKEERWGGASSSKGGWEGER